MLPTLLEAKAEVDALIIHSGESGLFSPNFESSRDLAYTVDSITRRTFCRTCSAETMQYSYITVGSYLSIYFTQQILFLPYQKNSRFRARFRAMAA